MDEIQTPPQPRAAAPNVDARPAVVAPETEAPTELTAAAWAIEQGVAHAHVAHMFAHHGALDEHAAAKAKKDKCEPRLHGLTHETKLSPKEWAERLAVTQKARI